MQEATKYLRKREWSMGNGQCPDCHGVPQSWYGHPLHMEPGSIGHERGCALAAALRGLGDTPLMKGEFTSSLEYENYISDEGFYGTRPKTADGCPRSSCRCRHPSAHHRHRGAAAMSTRTLTKLRRIARQCCDSDTTDALDALIARLAKQQRRKTKKKPAPTTAET